jgi:hypothetical protein
MTVNQFREIRCRVYALTRPACDLAARYRHVVASVRRDVAIQVGGLLWKPPAAPAPPAPADEAGGEGPLTAA